MQAFEIKDAPISASYKRVFWIHKIKTRLFIYVYNKII